MRTSRTPSGRRAWTSPCRDRALRAELEAQTREAAAKYAGALEEETAERKSGDASVGGKIADAVGAVAEELRRSVLELAADLTTESETLRAHCEAHAERAVAALQNTVTEGLGLNAEALEELRGDVAAAVEKAEGMEAAPAPAPAARRTPSPCTPTSPRRRRSSARCSARLRP